MTPPRNTEEAQYHLAFPVAAALVDGEVGPRQVLPPRIFDPELLDLAARVESVEEPRYEAVFPAKALAEVEVTTSDGRRLSSGTVDAAWEPPDSLPADTELEHKFQWLVEPVLGAEATQHLVDDVWGLETVDDVRHMVKACTVPERPRDRSA